MEGGVGLKYYSFEKFRAYLLKNIKNSWDFDHFWCFYRYLTLYEKKFLNFGICLPIFVKNMEIFNVKNNQPLVFIYWWLESKSLRKRQKVVKFCPSCKTRQYAVSGCFLNFLLLYHHHHKTNTDQLSWSYLGPTMVRF